MRPQALVSFVLLALGGCLAAPIEPGPESPRRDDLVSHDHPVEIVDYEDGRGYTFDLDRIGATRGRLLTYYIAADGPARVVATLHANLTASPEHDTCVAASAMPARLGVPLPEPDGFAAVLVRPRSSYEAAGHVAGFGAGLEGVRSPLPSDAVSSVKQGEWLIEPGDELRIEIGVGIERTTGPVIDLSSVEADLQVHVRAFGPTHVIGPRPLSRQFLQCGVGQPEALGSGNTGLEVGPLSAHLGVWEGWRTSELGSTLAFLDPDGVSPGQDFDVVFGDRTIPSPDEFLATDVDEPVAGLDFHTWTRGLSREPVWFLATTYWPFAEGAGPAEIFAEDPA